MKKKQTMISHKTICGKLCIILFIVLLAPFAWPGTSTSTETSIHQPLPSSESQVPRISPEELKERLDKKEKITIVDVRSVKEFDAQHIAGAISIPLHQVLLRQKELPREQEIVFY
jgi:3-mercaptopyruvate sulfurtransferase SseA